MGVAFITKKAEEFEQKTDKEFEDQIATGNLFSGLAETVQDWFRCVSTNGELPQPGTGVLLYDNGTQIDVVLNNKCIGRVMSPDASELRKLMAHTGAEVFTALVVEVQTLSKIFTVQVTMPKS
jgi:hypothetical protein